jgi:hypothetical protein
LKFFLEEMVHRSERGYDINFSKPFFTVIRYGYFNSFTKSLAVYKSVEAADLLSYYLSVLESAITVLCLDTFTVHETFDMKCNEAKTNQSEILK